VRTVGGDQAVTFSGIMDACATSAPACGNFRVAQMSGRAMTPGHMYPLPRLPLLLLSLCLGISPALAALPPAKRQMALESGREKNFGDSPVIIVPTIYLKLSVSGHIFVAKQGSALSAIGGGSPNTARASARYTVNGLDKKFLQEVAAKVYDDFVAKVRAAGYTVKTYADIKDLDKVKTAERAKPDAAMGLPTEKDRNNVHEYVVVAPSDEQTFVETLTGGVFSQFTGRGGSALGEGTVVIPVYTIISPQIGGEVSETYSTISAGIKSAPGMTLASVSVPLLTQKGGWGDAHLKTQFLPIAVKVGELTAEDTTSKAGNAFSKGVSLLTGAGQINTKSATFTFAVDQPAYMAGVLEGTAAFNDLFGKVVAGVRKK